jgi:hypothetical protein
MAVTTITITIPGVDVDHLGAIAPHFVRRVNTVYGKNIPDPTPDAAGKTAFEAVLALWVPRIVIQWAKENLTHEDARAAAELNEITVAAWNFGEGL